MADGQALGRFKRFALSVVSAPISWLTRFESIHRFHQRLIASHPAQHESSIDFLRHTEGPSAAIRVRLTICRALIETGDFANADKHMEIALQEAKSTYGSTSHITVEVLVELSSLRREEKRYDEAVTAAREAYETATSFDDPEEWIERSMRELASALIGAKDPIGAAALLEPLIQMTTMKSGPAHRSTLGALASLSRCYHELGRYEEAHALMSRCLSGLQRTFGPRHEHTVNAKAWLEHFAEHKLYE